MNEKADKTMPHFDGEDLKLSKPPVGEERKRVVKEMVKIIRENERLEKEYKEKYGHLHRYHSV